MTAAITIATPKQQDGVAHGGQLGQRWPAAGFANALAERLRVADHAAQNDDQRQLGVKRGPASSHDRARTAHEKHAQAAHQQEQEPIAAVLGHAGAHAA